MASGSATVHPSENLASAGQRVRRIRLNVEVTEPKIRSELLAEVHGFNLKADKLVKAHQRWKLMRLLRYVARPPVALERLFMADDGKPVRYLMKNPGLYKNTLTNDCSCPTGYTAQMSNEFARTCGWPGGALAAYAGPLNQVLNAVFESDG